MAPVALLARWRPPVGLLAGSSSSRTEFQRREKTYTLAAFLPRRWPETQPTPLPGPRTASPGEPQAAQARSCLVGIRLPAHITGSPLTPALCKATALRSCTTRRASLLLSDD